MKTAPKKSLFAHALLCCLGAAPLAVWSAEAAKGAVASLQAAAVAQAETMVLRVSLNTEDKGDLFVARTPTADFLVRTQDLTDIGFTNPVGSTVLLDDEPHISLQSMEGVRFIFDEKKLALNITADPGLLPNQALQLRADNRIRGVMPRGSSAFLNYAISSSASYAGAVNRNHLDFSAEAGWRLGDYLLMSNGSTVPGLSNERKFVRLMSSATYDDRDNLRRTVVGDFFSPSREFSNGLNMGGISVSKLYGLDPYLTRVPTRNITGSVATPSTVEVYVDGQRIRSETLKPGEFELRDLLAYGGARDVQVVLRDAFGRIQQFSYSFYFSDQPLRQGLQEYSYNLGAIRRSYGQTSNDYGATAFSMFHRYGLSQAITLGLRADAASGFYNAGPTATVVLGSAGVLSMALAASQVSDRQGVASQFNYNYQARSWGMGLSLRRDWGEFAVLGDPPSISNRHYEANATVSRYMQKLGSLSLSYSVLAVRPTLLASAGVATQPFSISAQQARRVTSLSYFLPLVSGRASLQASVSRTVDSTSRNEAYLGLSYFFDKDYSVASNLRSDRGDRGNTTGSVQLTKNQPIGEGLGYLISADRTTSEATANSSLNSRFQYNAPAAVVRGEVGRYQNGDQNSDSYQLSVAGGLAYVGGELGVGRPITQSFGIVKVGELPGVAVSVNNQLIGKTDARGQVFIPTLAPYFDNDVSIAPETVPIEYSIPSTVKKISPSLRSGAVIDFEVTKVQAFTGKLLYVQDGTEKPMEFQEISFSADGKTITLQTGRGGEYYVENLKPGNYPATVEVAGKLCRFELKIPTSDETFVELREAVCR
ncbi:MAG: fimbria/pilus outer membrane usher protein [Polaromonas sp.]|nr:fimbria/pilus outer membrane usher protein [Polaromonas sp.]